MALDHFFKPVQSKDRSSVSKETTLPSPMGPLSKVISPSIIAAANNKVTEALAVEAAGTSERARQSSAKRGKYEKYTPRVKAQIGNYALQHGTSAAIRRFKDNFPNLKWSTVNDWKSAIIKKVKQGSSSIHIQELVDDKRGRPPILPESIAKDLRRYVYAVRDRGGVINTAVLIAAGTGMLQQREPALMQCNGGSDVLQKSWAKYFLKKMNFVKRKATTKSSITVVHFDELKQQYLMDVKVVVEMEEIPDSLIINWDQTGLNYVPVSQWTMDI